MIDNKLLTCLINRRKKIRIKRATVFSRVYCNVVIRILQNSCSSAGSFNDMESIRFTN